MQRKSTSGANLTVFFKSKYKYNNNCDSIIWIVFMAL